MLSFCGWVGVGILHMLFNSCKLHFLMPCWKVLKSNTGLNHYLNIVRDKQRMPVRDPTTRTTVSRSIGDEGGGEDINENGEYL